MARYQIKDPQSGKTVTVEGSKPPSQQEADQLFQQAGLRKPAESGVSSFLRNVGLGVLPDITNTVGGTALAAAGGIGYGVGKATGNQDLQTGGQNLYTKGAQMASTGEQKFGFSPPGTPGNELNAAQFATQTGKDVAGAVSYAIPLGKAGLVDRAINGGFRGALNGVSQDNVTPGGVAGRAALGAAGEAVLPPIMASSKKITSNVKDIIKNPTMRSAGKNVSKAVTEATARGASIGWDKGENNLVDQIQKSVQDKLPWNKDVREATNNLIASLTKTPDTIVNAQGLPMIGNTKLTPADLLKTRTQLQNLNGPSIFSPPQDLKSATEMKVAGIVRNVMSQNLHKLAPETLPPDKVLAIYHNIPLQLGKFGLPGLLAEGVGLTKGIKKLADFLGVVAQ